MSNFAFLADEFAEIHASAQRAETLANGDPRASAFYARRTLEILVKWVFKHDPSFNFPYQDNLSALIHEPSFKRVAGEAVFAKARLLVKIGNRAVHDERDTPQRDAQQAVRDLFHVCFWLARTYARKSPPPDGLRFDEKHLSRKDDIVRQSFVRLQQMQQEMEAKDENLTRLLRDRNQLDEELKALRAEVAEARKENAARRDTHDYSEAETRDYFIDLLLREAGWTLDGPNDLEYEVVGMEGGDGKGYVDYVLWGDDGKPLAVVEAKRTRRDARVGQQQAKLYADCLERMTGQRPVIFYTNGYDHWIWDDLAYPPRAIEGFLKKDELQLLVQRRIDRKPLVGVPVNEEIAGRYYQTRAIAAIARSFEVDRQRKALLVMATGSGKTRTVIALVDLLMRRNWVKRVLFLADRVALVRQAVNAFKAHLPDAAPVNLVTDRTGQGRVFVSTYPTMMGLIDQKSDEGRLFGPGHFDLVIIDEAHRSVYERYGAIFDYFDSLLVGLTATPKDEVSRNTYELFDLEQGVPTDAYTLDKAVEDEYLVPPRAISVPLKFPREGIKYDELSDEEKDQWDMLEWDEDEPPDSIDSAAINQWLFNTDTVDKVLAHVMNNGIKVEGGDRLGKTILFAKNQRHADFIEERFNHNYPSLAGHFARVITHKTERAQSLIDDFSTKDKAPHIAITVDMLDTGIDVPEVVNLVLFKLVRSKTKFWQMLGRGTRLCENLFGPGMHKENFFVFDFCENLEFFRENLPGAEASRARSLTERLFALRFDLVRAIDEELDLDGPGGFAEEGDGYEGEDEPPALKAVRDEALQVLMDHVAAMNLENFVVRQNRRLVEKYKKPESWRTLSDDKRDELLESVAPLPSEVKGENEEAKRFDVLMFSLELALLKGNRAFPNLRRKLVEIAAALELQGAIPVVAARMELIQDIQSDGWWEGITVPLLELARKRLRMLVQHIEKGQRTIVYTNFEDELGEGSEIGLRQVGEVDYARFKRKARDFLREHMDNIALQKLRHGKPLTPTDIGQLQAMLVSEGVGSDAEVEKAIELNEGLGRFIRSLVGLDRAAVSEAFSSFTAGTTATSKQIEFIGMIVEHLTEKGTMDPGLLYESPFTYISPAGPEKVFDLQRTAELIEVIERLNESAAVSS